jgi:pimeloyl-ACP methyl ester carboxylesterase
MTARERTVIAGGTPLHVRETGDGLPLLLINGIGAHVAMWRPLEDALPGVRRISFDAPGTGRSPAARLPRTIGRLADLVTALLDALGLDRVDVLGYSFGGAVAQQLAAEAPDRVRRLVLAATFPGWGGVPGNFSAMIVLGSPLRYHSRQIFMRTAGLVGGGRARTDAAYVRDRWEERSERPPSFTGYTHQLWAMTGWSGLTRLDRITAPTLIVLGDDDPVIPVGNAFLMASRMPDARVLIAPGEGHFLLMDTESAALPAIGAFLTAPALADAPVWRDARRPTAAEAADQLRADGMGAQPWGVVSAAIRTLTDPHA